MAAIAGAYFTGFLLPAVQRAVHSGDTTDRRNWCIQGLSIYFIATVSGTCDSNAVPSVRADRIVQDDRIDRSMAKSPNYSEPNAASERAPRGCTSSRTLQIVSSIKKKGKSRDSGKQMPHVLHVSHV